MMVTRLWSRSSDSEDEVMELSLWGTSSSSSSSCCTSDEDSGERDYLSEGDGWHEYEDPSWVRDDNLKKPAKGTPKPKGSPAQQRVKVPRRVSKTSFHFLPDERLFAGKGASPLRSSPMQARRSLRRRSHGSLPPPASRSSSCLVEAADTRLGTVMGGGDGGWRISDGDVPAWVEGNVPSKHEAGQTTLAEEDESSWISEESYSEKGIDYLLKTYYPQSQECCAIDPDEEAEEPALGGDGTKKAFPHRERLSIPALDLVRKDSSASSSTFEINSSSEEEAEDQERDLAKSYSGWRLPLSARSPRRRDIGQFLRCKSLDEEVTDIDSDDTDVSLTRTRSDSSNHVFVRGPKASKAKSKNLKKSSPRASARMGEFSSSAAFLFDRTRGDVGISLSSDSAMLPRAGRGLMKQSGTLHMPETTETLASSSSLRRATSMRTAPSVSSASVHPLPFSSSATLWSTLSESASTPSASEKQSGRSLSAIFRKRGSRLKKKGSKSSGGHVSPRSDGDDLSPPLSPSGSSLSHSGSVTPRALRGLKQSWREVKLFFSPFGSQDH